MRLLMMFGVCSGLVATAACEVATDGASAASRPLPAPTAVSCSDAAQLAQRALDERRRREDTSSDQDKVVAGARATFYASLATVARLKCKTPVADVDETLKPAFDAARRAEATHSFYERAVQWADANFIVTQVVDRLMTQQE